MWGGGHGLRAELSRGDNMAGERQEVRVALRWPLRIPLPIGGDSWTDLYVFVCCLDE